MILILCHHWSVVIIISVVHDITTIGPGQYEWTNSYQHLFHNSESGSTKAHLSNACRPLT